MTIPITIGPGGDDMAKSHYSFKKHQKEMARKLKQEQKRQRKLDKGAGEPEEASDESQKPEATLEKSGDTVNDLQT
jgi:hypothetical protein